jgi:GT2 family glycosyltransferase
VTEPLPHVYAVIPVHNRLAVTRRCLEQLRAMRFPALTVVVVDDGSTDGTGEMLARFEGLEIWIVRGDGSLWWGGAMEKGMRRVDEAARDGDAVLMLNDDVELAPNFLESLTRAAGRLGITTVVGCVQRDLDGGHPGYFGYRIDYRKQSIDVMLASEHAGPVVDVDALVGRGVLIPVRVMRTIGLVDALRFPHYWGDIEYTARARDLGYRVCCLSEVPVWTSFAPSDAKVADAGWRARFLSRVSSRNVMQRLSFWRRRGPAHLRRLAALRYAWLQVARVLSQPAAKPSGKG